MDVNLLKPIRPSVVIVTVIAATRMQRSLSDFVQKHNVVTSGTAVPSKARREHVQDDIAGRGTSRHQSVLNAASSPGRVMEIGVHVDTWDDYSHADSDVFVMRKV
jgi:hypothetical protein